MLACSNTILSSELTLIASRYYIFLCQFVISYPRTSDHPTTASTVPILRRPSALLHSTMVSKVPWMGWLSWILQALVDSKREGNTPWNEKPLPWCKLARVFWGGLFCYMHPSKYFHCVHHKFLHLLVLSHVLACKAGTSKISPEPPVYFQKKKLRLQTKRRLQNVGIRMMECDKCDTTRGILSISKSGRGKDLRYELWTLRPDPACNRQADFLHSLTKGLNTRTSTGNIKCR